MASSTPSAGAVTVVLTPPVGQRQPDHGILRVPAPAPTVGSPRSQTGTTTTIKVSGLDGGKNYRCRARATNAAGTGPYGAYGATVLLPAPTAPGGTPVASSTPSAGAVTVVLTPPAANGSPITGYSVTCYSTDGGVTKVSDRHHHHHQGERSGRREELPLPSPSHQRSRHRPLRRLRRHRAPPSPDSARRDAVASSTPSAGAVTVVLTPPAANGSPITGYSVTCVQHRRWGHPVPDRHHHHHQGQRSGRREELPLPSLGPPTLFTCGRADGSGTERVLVPRAGGRRHGRRHACRGGRGGRCGRRRIG